MAVLSKTVNIAFRVDEAHSDDFFNQHISKGQKKLLIERARKLQKHIVDMTSKK